MKPNYNFENYKTKNLYEIASQKYAHNEIIPVCAVSYQEMKKGERKDLEIRINNTWIKYTPPKKDYQNYSHGFSDEGFKKMYPLYYWEKYVKEHFPKACNWVYK